MIVLLLITTHRACEALSALMLSGAFLTSFLIAEIAGERRGAAAARVAPAGRWQPTAGNMDHGKTARKRSTKPAGVCERPSRDPCRARRGPRGQLPCACLGSSAFPALSLALRAPPALRSARSLQPLLRLQRHEWVLPAQRDDALEIAGLRNLALDETVAKPPK